MKRHSFGWWKSLAIDAAKDTAEQVTSGRSSWFGILMAGAAVMALACTLRFGGYGPDNPYLGDPNISPRQAQDSGQTIQVGP